MPSLESLLQCSFNNVHTVGTWFFTGKWKCQELTIGYYNFACNNFKSHYDHLILQHALGLRAIYQGNSMPVTILGSKDFRANTAVLRRRKKAAENECWRPGSCTGAPWLSLCYVICNLNLFTLNPFVMLYLWLYQGRRRRRRGGGTTWGNCSFCRGGCGLQGLDTIQHVPCFNQGTSHSMGIQSGAWDSLQH